MADSETSAESPRDRRMMPFWIWLAIAVVTPFLGVPAEPISTFIALAYGMISFSIGAILSSQIPLIYRVIGLTLWLILAIPFALFAGGLYLTLVALGFLTISILMGCWASHRLGPGRSGIILWFAVGYLLGSLLGVLFTIAGAVTGAILAKRSYKRSPEPLAENSSPE